jgi:hypothetical protein
MREDAPTGWGHAALPVVAIARTNVGVTAVPTLRRVAPDGVDTSAARDYRIPLAMFMALVLAHWAEHIAQAIQVFVLGWNRPDAGGVLGQLWPWLVMSEWLHYGYAVAMLIGLWLLRDAFHGTARTWWMIALAIQVWHHLEHALLLMQVLLDDPFFGRQVPTSIVQLAFPRVELHLFYNGVVFTPMVIAIYLEHFHRRKLAPMPDASRA